MFAFLESLAWLSPCSWRGGWAVPLLISAPTAVGRVLKGVSARLGLDDVGHGEDRGTRLKGTLKRQSQPGWRRHVASGKRLALSLSQDDAYLHERP